MISHFVANSEKCRKNTFLGGPPRLLRYYIGGLSKFITILHGGGGLPNLLQYYNGGGRVSRDPKFVLRNIWTAPNNDNHDNQNRDLQVGKFVGHISEMKCFQLLPGIVDSDPTIEHN